MSWNIRNIVYYILNIWMAVLSFFLGFRILFELFGANQSTPFVAWVYDVSAAFMSPFANIFPNLSFGPNSSLDVVAIISLVAYAILNYIIMSIFDSLVTATTTTTYTEHRHI